MMSSSRSCRRRLRQFERAASPQTSSPRQRSPTCSPLALQIGSNKLAGGQSLASTGSTRAQDGSVGRGVARGDGSDVRGSCTGGDEGLGVGSWNRIAGAFSRRVFSIDRKHRDTRLIAEQVARATGEIYEAKFVLNLAPRRCPVHLRYEADPGRVH